MTRKMAWIGLFYLTGLFAASFFASETALTAGAALALSALPAALLFGRKYAKAGLCMFSAAAGLLLYGVYGYFVYSDIAAYDGEEITAEGVILDFKEYKGDSTLYLISGKINGGTSARMLFFGDSSFAETGDRVSLAGKAQVMEDTYTFPTGTYYGAKGIFLQINGVKAISYERTGFSLRRTLNAYREHIRGVMREYMDRDCAAIMTAMLFGDKSDIDSAEKTLMYRAGIGHIMAVSGVHLTVVCSFFWFFISRLKINKFLRYGLFLIPVLCFVMLAGMSNSVIRAALMISIVYGGELFRRRSDCFNSLGIAVIVLTVFTPYAVRDASFLLSAAGVFGIGVAAPMVIKELGKTVRLNFAEKSVISSLCVMLTTFPVTLLFFDEVSLCSPITNLILLPICSAVLIGGVIVTLTGGVGFIAAPVLKLCNMCCRAVRDASLLIGGLGVSYIPVGKKYTQIAAAAAIAVSVGAMLICGSKKRGAFISAGAIACAMVFTGIYRFVPDDSVTVAVLKEKTAVTAVVHNNISACAADIYKGGRASKTAAKYLSRNGLYNIDAVIMNTDANYSIAAYDDRLKLFDRDMMLVPDDDIALTDGYPFGRMSFYGRDSDEVRTSYCSICFIGDGGISVKSGSREILLLSPAAAGREKGMCYAETGGSVIPIEESMVFTIKRNGKVTYRPI